MPERTYEQDHYEVLMLPSSKEDGTDLNKKDIKLAYRRALLLHHPDKSTLACDSKPKHSVDQITIAYKTLVDPKVRSDYDRLRALKLSTTTTVSRTSHPGLETVDLDDLSYNDHEGIWYGSCRCGREQAYILSEEELEASAEHGEIVTGCQGCSLWLRVTFAVAEDV